MIELARPGFLQAGALLAALPLVLHFFRPKERARRVLPTVRFLSPESRARIRPRRRPDELLLLALRVALCLLLGAAFAGASWVGPSEGTGTVVVVDAAGAAETTLAEAVRGLEGRVSVAVVGASDDGPPEVVWRDFGDAEAAGSGEATPLAEGAGGPAGEPESARLAHLLGAVREGAARSTGVDSLRARIVADPSWGAWGPGLREARGEWWPGRVELLEVDRTSAPSPGPPTSAVAIRGPDAIADRVAGALGVLGVDGAGPDEEASVTLRLGPEDRLGSLWEVDPGDAPPDGAVGAFLLLDGRRVPGAGRPPRGTPTAGATVPLLGAGGRPRAAARRSSDGCEIAFPVDADAPVLSGNELPVLLESLLHEGCGLALPVAPGRPGGAGADLAWRALLQEDARPPVVAAAPLRGPGAGISLTRLFLALALAAALAETLRARTRERMREAKTDR